MCLAAKKKKESSLLKTSAGELVEGNQRTENANKALFK